MTWLRPESCGGERPRANSPPNRPMCSTSCPTPSPSRLRITQPISDLSERKTKTRQFTRHLLFTHHPLCVRMRSTRATNCPIVDKLSADKAPPLTSVRVKSKVHFTECVTKEIFNSSHSAWEPLFPHLSRCACLAGHGQVDTPTGSVLIGRVFPQSFSSPPR